MLYTLPRYVTSSQDQLLLGYGSVKLSAAHSAAPRLQQFTLVPIYNILAVLTLIMVME